MFYPAGFLIGFSVYLYFISVGKGTVWLTDYTPTYQDAFFVAFIALFVLIVVAHDSISGLLIKIHDQKYLD